MGIAKRMMQEDEDRGYYLSNNQLVCSNCIDEYGIKSFIEENASNSECSYCQENGSNTKSCNIDLVVEYILNCVRSEWGDPNNEGLPYETREGGWQGSVCDTWDLLSNLGVDVREGEIFNHIVTSIQNEQWCKRNPYSLTTDRTLMYGWTDFCKFVINTSRYFFLNTRNNDYDVDQHDEMDPVKILDALGAIVKKLDLIQTIPVTTVLKRVRIVDMDTSLSSARDLGSPPRQFCKMANRMSPAGISMFYGAFDVDTAIKETYEEEKVVTKKAICGNFNSTRPLTVIDLSKNFHIPSIFDQHEREHRDYIKFLIDFITDFTKPIERADRAHIDYVPTQIVTEYFRHILPEKGNITIDGVIYPSSKNEGHQAIVIFADSKQCVEKSESDGLLAMDNFEIIEL